MREPAFFTSSIPLGGLGFRYRSGGARSWWLYIIDLRDFLFRYDLKSNTGIGYVKGYWHGPVQIIVDVF